VAICKKLLEVQMISWERVNELRDEIGDEDFAEVADMFLEEVEEVILRLDSSPKPETLEEELHSLKGSALNLGFEALSKLCQEGERQAASGNFTAISLPDVFDTYHKSKGLFRKEIPQGAPTESGSLELL